MSNLITKGHAIAGKLTVRTGGAALNGAVTINEDGGDYDFRVEADSNTNALNVDAGLFTGVGSIGVGSAAVNTASVTIDPPALTAVTTVDYAKLRLDNTAAVTIPAGTTTSVSSLHVGEPNITATGTVTNAATVYIEAAPTEGGTSNHALHVDAGTVRFDSGLVVNEDGNDADTRVESDTNANLLVLDAGLFTGVGAVGVGAAASSAGMLLVDPPALSAAASTSYGVLRVGNTGTLTIPAGTTSVAAGLLLAEPTLTVTGTLTNGAGIYVQNATVGASNNYSIWVDNGAARFDSGMVINEDGVDEDTRIEADTNANAIVVDAGLFTGVGAVGLLGVATNAASVLVNPPAMSAVATVDYAKVHIDNGAAVTVPAGTTALVAGLRVDEPNITATGTVTTSASLYVEAAATEGTNNHALLVDAGSTRLDGALLLGGNAGDATTVQTLLVKKTGIADNTATDVITVTVPNANAAAAIRLTFVASLGAGTDTFESTRTALGLVVLARQTGANVVGTAVALTNAGIASVSGGGTLTLAYDLGAVAGAVGASNTFTIRVTQVVTGTITNHQCMVLAECINAEAGGVTIAAA